MTAHSDPRIFITPRRRSPPAGGFLAAELDRIAAALPAEGLVDAKTVHRAAGEIYDRRTTGRYLRALAAAGRARTELVTRGTIAVRLYGRPERAP